jgi:hypothetical protein
VQGWKSDLGQSHIISSSVPRRTSALNRRTVDLLIDSHLPYFCDIMGAETSSKKT